MFSIKDTDDNWASLKDLETIVFEDGTEKKITTTDLILDFWAKYKGRPLSEVNDEKDLQFLMKVAFEKDDGWAERCVNMRLLEIK